MIPYQEKGIYTKEGHKLFRQRRILWRRSKGSSGFENFVHDIFFNPTRFYYIARFINSCLNILLAFFTYKIAKEYFNSKMALMSLFLAIFPFFDRLVSFKIRIDTLLAVWSILAVYFSLKIFETGKLKYYLLVALFFGLGLATKPLPALLILPTIFLSHFCGFQKDKVFTKREIKQLKKKREKEKIENTIRKDTQGAGFLRNLQQSYFILL